MKDTTCRSRRTRGKIRKCIRLALYALLIAAMLLAGCRSPFPTGLFDAEKDTVRQFFASLTDGRKNAQTDGEAWLTLNGEAIPPFDGETAVIELNGNAPLFTEEEKAAALAGEPFESYSSLDRYKRAGAATACLVTGMMPGKERGSIDYPRTSGYVNRRYAFIDNGQYLYNHCHLIGYQLTGQTNNPNNLITGTRFMNLSGMLPYENLVAYQLYDSKHRVLYRVTPVYVGSELVARGVEMEALSVEDNGRELSFHVFCYNAQPGVTIDYATGENRADGTK